MKLLSIASSLLLAASVYAQDPTTFKVGAFDFKRPEGWQWVPVTSQMRKAQLKVPGKDPSQSAEITFFHFGSGQGGDAASNAKRWFNQFKSKEGAENIEKVDLSGTKATIVTTEGTFSSGMPGGPATQIENAALLGAILENPEGDVFVKMTGPAEIVKAAQPQFMDFLKAAAVKK